MNATALLMASLVVGPQNFTQPASPGLGDRGSLIVVDRAIVIAKADQLVPARDAGALSEVLVVEGQYVEQGQLLARMDDKDLLAQRKTRALELDLAIEQAKSTVEEEAAIATFRTAQVELEESLEINELEDGAVPATAVRRQQLQADRAKLQAEVAREERKIAILQTHVRAAEVEIADVAIARRKIHSPIRGKVVQLARRPGEWLQPGDQLLRVVRMDVLRMEGFVRSNKALPYELEGLPVFIVVKSPAGDIDVEGVIAFANPVLSGQDGEFRIVAELNNLPHPTREYAWLINPGMGAKMTIDRNAAPAPLAQPPVGGQPQVPSFPPSPEPLPGTLPPIDSLPPAFGAPGR